MAEFQIVGDEQKLSKGPKNEDPHGFKGGKFQAVGDMAPIGSTPVPLQQGKVANKGKFQNIGTHQPLSQTPQKGWNSFNTPMSDRTKFAALIPGLKKGK